MVPSTGPGWILGYCTKSKAAHPAWPDYHTTIKTGAELRNVGDAAYAMSHTTAMQCTEWLTRGRGIDGYQVTSIQSLVNVMGGVFLGWTAYKPNPMAMRSKLVTGQLAD